MVIPAFEEASAVGVVVQSLRAAATWREVLVIDDGSTDETAIVASAAGAEVVMTAQDTFWGARYGRVRDPFGHVWAFNAPLKESAA